MMLDYSFIMLKYNYPKIAFNIFLIIMCYIMMASRRPTYAGAERTYVSDEWNVVQTCEVVVHHDVSGVSYA